MSHQIKNNNTKNISINPEKYFQIISEIEKFIKAKEETPTKIKGIVKKVDLDNNLITIKLQSTGQSNLSKGSLILIKEGTLFNEIKKMRATVKETYGSTLEIEIENNPSQFENKKVIIDSNKTNVIIERLKNIIENVKENKLSPDNIKILDFLIGENKPRYNKRKVSFFSKNFNKDQKETIVKSIEADDFHLIVGPPGTGKTYIIEELVKQFSKKNQKLLITAWTNLAIDNIIKRLTKKESTNIVRIGSLNEIDPEVKKYSIFEKIKKHKNWIEIDEYHKTVDKLFKLLSEIKDEIVLAQKNIDINQNNITIFNRELNNFINEKEKCEKILSVSIKNKNWQPISSMNDEIIKLSQKSGTFLSLSKDILLINELWTRIPKIEYIKNLKKQTRNMKFLIIKKKIFSFFNDKDNKQFEKLKESHTKNTQYLKEISELQKKYNNLKTKCEKNLRIIYADNNRHPDEDALKSEFEIYEILKNKYLPFFEKQEISNSETKTFKINQEVYKIYLESLNIKIDLLNTKIQNTRIDFNIQINHKKDSYNQHKNIKKEINLNNQNIYKLTKAITSEIIENTDIIVATAISSCHYFLKNTQFDVMIMDEASQVASFMSLLPLSKCKKFILVGDNKQLQPIEEENISKEMNRSIFNRLFEKYPNASTFLSTQYRMHKTIAKIANEIFYKGKLKTSKKIAEKILNLKTGKHQFLNPKIPIIFIDTSKVKYYEDEVGTGCSNMQEAKYVAYIVSLFIKNNIKAKDIGVVTPYVKQKLLIKSFLEDIKIKNVEIDTVHKFQGREKDIIIMSFAKSKKYPFPQYKLKFIENETLINVSITRAKRKLILIGNSKTLCQSKLLNKIINKIENKIEL